MTQEPFSIPLRVHYQHTDAGGVVYYANYLAFMEAARMELMHAIGADLGAIADRGEALFVVYSVEIQYHQPARLGDMLRVTARLAKLGRARMEFDQRVFRGDEELVTGRVVAACVHPKTFKPVAIPASVRAQLEKTP